jgi:hypothetical protein
MTRTSPHCTRPQLDTDEVSTERLTHPSSSRVKATRWTTLLTAVVMMSSGDLAAKNPGPVQAPAARVFGSDAGMILNAIKEDKTADVEAVVATLTEALQKSDKRGRKQQAAGGRR